MVTLVFPLSHCTLFTFFAAKNLMVDLSSFKVVFFFDLLFSLTVIFFLCLPAFFNAFLTAFLTERLTFEVFLLPVTFTTTTIFFVFFKSFFCCIGVALGVICWRRCWHRTRRNCWCHRWRFLRLIGLYLIVSVSASVTFNSS